MDALAKPVRQRLSRVPFLALALALAAACGSDGDGPTEPPATGSIAIALSPTSITLAPGEEGTTTVTLTRSGGFSGAVELSLEGAPAGVTGSFSPATIAAGSTSSTLTLAVAETATPGAHNLTVRAHAEGVSDKTVTLSLTIEAPPEPDFRIVLEKGRANLAQGREGLVGLTVERLNGFDGPITLSLEGAPAGMTAQLMLDDEADPSEGAVGISLDRHVHVGDHALTVRAVSGTLTRTAELVVRVLQSRPVAAAWSYSLAIADDGTLWSWGRNEHGQLGLGDTTDRNAPVRVSADTTWVAVAAGYAHSIALKSDGSLWIVGDNGYGQLGNGTTQGYVPQPQRVGADNDWLLASAGVNGGAVVAIKTDGTLWGWGRNISGELGLNGEEALTPRKLSSMNGWVDVATGSGFTIVLNEDGNLWASGSNARGKLGIPDNNNHYEFAPVPGSGWVYVATGDAHALAITHERALISWGSNQFGELGQGTSDIQGNGQVPGFVVRWP